MFHPLENGLLTAELGSANYSVRSFFKISVFIVLAGKLFWGVSWVFQTV